MTTPETYRPQPSGRFAADLTSTDDIGDIEEARSTRSHTPESNTPEPKASPAARFWTVLLGLLLLVGCGVIIRDILIVNDITTGDQLLPPLYDWFATVHYESWMLWAGIGCAFVALIFLFVTLRPRRRTHIALDSSTRFYGRPVDIARVATATARRIPGVLTAQSVVTRKKIQVTADTAVDQTSADDIRYQVHSQISDLAESLEPTPDVTVTLTTGRSVS